MKKQFLIYIDQLDILDELTNEQIGELFLAIKNYAKGKKVELSQILKIAFIPIKNQMDRDLEKYEKICKRNAENGLKGGRPKNPKEPKKPTGLFGNPKKRLEPKKAQYDTDTENDNEKENNISNEIQPSVEIIPQKETKKIFSEISEKEIKVQIYGNDKINAVSAFLKKSVGLSTFKETETIQRRYFKHILNLVYGTKKKEGIGKEKFLFRLKNILGDDFKSKNCNSIRYLYEQLKSFIHSPIVEPNTPKKQSRVVI